MKVKVNNSKNKMNNVTSEPVEDHQFTDIDISLGGALPECNNAEGTQAADLDLTTCTGQFKS